MGKSAEFAKVRRGQALTKTTELSDTPIRTYEKYDREKNAPGYEKKSEGEKKPKK